jgi:photosystem II stability/assembly factor-like uncharacterized protein
MEGFSLRTRVFSCLLAAAFLLVTGALAPAQQFDPERFRELRWRMIGPFRGGRMRAAAGVPSQPNVFYAGAVNGGVWKTNDYGRAWTPIFDTESTGSIGAIVVAPSDPNVIYVASGEGLHRPDLSTGDGIYKSTDAGKTWTHLGLRDTQQIPGMAVDPRDPNRLFVAVLGHPYGPNPERGIFRSLDGGQTFEKVLYQDENTGGSMVELDPVNPEIVYAGLWEAREGPWENAAWEGTGGGLFKSVDGGKTWRQLTRGLPPVVQVNVAIAPSRPARIYAEVAHDDTTTIYRSDDAGGNWTEATQDARPATRIGGGDLAVLKVDPMDPDTLYSASIVTWKSTDGGKTWTGFRGAPGGDDYQNIWINPNHPEIMLLTSDQGAIVTVNGGASWSSWYNQPTAQLYHVGADHAFPYRLCSGQQESGSVCINSRGNDGEITERDWRPVAAEEYAYVTPDPLDPDIVYGGKLSRFDRRTTQAQDVMPEPIPGKDFRVLRTQPIIFSPQDPHTLYFAANTLWKTRDGGQSWLQISPDLTREKWEIPATVGRFKTEKSAAPTQRGVIYAVAPSPVQDGLIWAGTDDGLIHLTKDGGAHWTNVTPPQLVPWAKVSILEAGHYDANTAYAAINTFRIDDLRPHILRTHDQGRTWTEIRNGIPDGEAVNVVREDPKRGSTGLLFAGTERQVYVSLDDGEHWQPLRQNMPATSIRDLLIKGDDLATATHGRGFWIMDDITPLRAAAHKPLAAGGVHLYDPQTALRVRWDTNTDTPLPPDVPAGENPPEGAILNYFLAQPAAGPVTLEILDAKGKTVRRYSSDDPVAEVDPARLEIPAYWVRPPQRLSSAAGFHRFVWDLHYSPVPGITPDYPMQAVFHNTAPAPTSPWVMPGPYTVRLTANGHTEMAPLKVEMDPRVKTSEADLARQFDLSWQLYQDVLQATAALGQINSLREQVKKLQEQTQEKNRDLTAFEDQLDDLAGGETRRRRHPRESDETLEAVRGALRGLHDLVQGADVAPTTQAVAASAKGHQALLPILARWEELETKELPQMNQRVKKSGLLELRLKPH